MTNSRDTYIEAKQAGKDLLLELLLVVDVVFAHKSIHQRDARLPFKSGHPGD